VFESFFYENYVQEITETVPQYKSKRFMTGYGIWFCANLYVYFFENDSQPTNVDYIPRLFKSIQAFASFTVKHL